MKNIITIILVFSCFALAGQTTKKVSNMTAASNPDANDILYFIEDGSSRNITKSLLQKSVRDSMNTNVSNIVGVNSDLSELRTDTYGVVDWVMSSSGDTVYMTYAGKTFKLLSVDAPVVDVTRPTVSAREAGNYANDTIVMTISETLASNTPATASFTATDAAGAVVIDYVRVSGDSVFLAVDTSFVSEEAITLTYVRPETDPLQDASGNTMLSFTSQSVKNNVNCQSADVLAAWHFENSAIDSSGNGYTLVSNNGATYELTEKIEGSYGGEIDLTNAYFAIPTMDLTSEFTLSFWFTAYSPSGLRTFYSTLQSLDGVQINYNFTNDQITFVTGNGSSTTTAVSSSGLSWAGDGTFHHIAIVGNKTSGSCNIYFDNVDVTSTGDIATDFATSSIGRLGIDFADAGDMFGYLDAFYIYSTALTSSDISDLYNSPGVRPTIGNCGDSPIPQDSVTVIMTADFEGITAQTNPPHDSITQAFDHLYYVGAELDNIFQTASIVSDGGDMVLRSHYPVGQCCTESEPGDAGDGGTGLLIRAWFTAAHTEYDEIYVSYNIRLESGFTIASGLKIPGLRAENGVGSQRLMLKPDLWLQYYNYVYSSSSSVSSSSSPTYMGDPDTLSTNEWVNVTHRLWIGTVDNYDGFHEVFIDRLLVDYRSGIMFNNSATTTTGWNLFDLSTFMGGDTPAFDADHTEYYDIDDITVWHYKSGSGVPLNSTPSGSSRTLTTMPTEANPDR